MEKSPHGSDKKCNYPDAEASRELKIPFTLYSTA
jgi:hypothetical protein